VRCVEVTPTDDRAVWMSVAVVRDLGGDVGLDPFQGRSADALLTGPLCPEFPQACRVFVMGQSGRYWDVHANNEGARVRARGKFGAENHAQARRVSPCRGAEPSPVGVAEHYLAADAGVVGRTATAADSFLMARGTVGGFRNRAWAQGPPRM